MNPFLEAVSMERDGALLAHEEALHVDLPVQTALLAVAPLGQTLLVQLCGDDPMVQPVEARLCG